MEEEPVLRYDSPVTILVQAQYVPDRSEVTKRTGTKGYTLRRNLTLYSDTKGEKPTTIEGLFLVGSVGDITQIKPDTLLGFHMPIGELHEWIEGNVPDLDPDWNK